MHSSLPSYLPPLTYFIKEHQVLFLILVSFSIGIGLIEGLIVALLYPIISLGLGIDTNSIPYAHFFTSVSSIISTGTFFSDLVIVFLLLTSLALIGQVVYWKLVYHFSKVVVYSVKENLYKTIRSSDYRLFEEKKQGELINIFMSGPSSITSSIETLMTLIADITLSGMIALSLYFVSDFGLLVLIIGGFLFYLVNAKVGGAVSRELGQLSYDSGMSENVIISEYISGIRAIRASNSTMFWENNAKKAILLYWDRYSEAKYLQRLPGLLIYSLFLLAIGFIILILFHFFQEGFSLVLPVVGAFAIGTLRIVPKLSAIGFEHLQLINGSIYVRSVYDFLTDNKYQNVQNGMISFENLNDDIIFHDVVFSYGHTPVLRGLSLTLKKGMVTAIVGPSGAGKSTITGLLLRLYDPDTGHILLNNKDFKEYEIGSLLNHVGYVGQEPFVFNASIRDNITFGIDYSDKEVYRAASLAHAHDFIEKLPDGYSTVIGDRGMKLSGGEKQRVVIARAMIRRPELLILDEATSSLDNISEALVQEAIDEVSKGCTTLVIAHRLTTIQKADWIYVIDGGEVIEEGKHEELMEQRGLYWGMYMRTLIDR